MSMGYVNLLGTVRQGDASCARHKLAQRGARGRLSGRFDERLSDSQANGATIPFVPLSKLSDNSSQPSNYHYFLLAYERLRGLLVATRSSVVSSWFNFFDSTIKREAGQIIFYLLLVYPNSSVTTSPPSTNLIGRPMRLMFSCVASIPSVW